MNANTDNLADHLIGKVRNLRAPSAAIIQLLTLLDAPDPDYDKIIAVVSRDAVLCAKLLSICNAAQFGLAQPVSSMDQAVVYLGFFEIHRLLMAIAFGEQAGVAQPGYHMQAGALWKHSLVTALVAPRVIARSPGVSGETSVAYTAGLLHDIGKLVLGQQLEAGRREQIHHLVESGGKSLLEAERSVLGCDHAQIGACLLRKWRIPEVIVEAVEFHHQPGDGAGLAGVLHVADVLAHQTGASPGWGGFAVTIQPTALTALGLSGECLEELTFAALDAHEMAAKQEGKGSTQNAGPTTAQPKHAAF